METPPTERDGQAGGVAPRQAQGDAALQDCLCRVLLENPLLWLTATDRDGTVVLWNRGAERISGYPRREVLGSGDVWARLFPEKRYRRKVWGRCIGPMADAGQGDVEVAIRCRDGHPAVVLWHLTASDEEAAGGCLALGRELTDRAHTVEVLDHPEAFFEKFLASLGVGVFRACVQSPGRSMMANPALARMLGFGSTSELLGFGYERLAPPAVREQIREQLERHGALRELEVQLVRHDATPVDVAITAQADYDDEGRLRVLTGTVEDIGRRKAAQLALKASEEKYRQLVEGMGEPVVTVDERGVCVAMNRAAAAYVGGEPENFEGRSLWSILPAETADAFMAIAHEAIDTGNPHSSELQTVLQGKRIWLQTRVHPLRGANGDVARAQVLALDITNRKLAEQEVMRYQERLRALAARLSEVEERERRSLAAELHDGISQSLALAIMKLGVLEDAMGRRRQAEALREVRGLAEQALRAARTLTSELSPPVLAEFGFGEALEWLAERTSERYGLPVRIEHDGPAPRLPEQAQTVLFKAVRELLANVGKHAQASEAVVSMRTDGNRIVVSVSDDGRGMGDGLDSVHTATGGGFGLFNVREQLSQLGGRMDVRSQPGSGTRVLLSMPTDAGGPGTPGGLA